VIDGTTASLIGAIVFVAAAPVAGMLLAGADRKLSARLQSRIGPPILQPYYDLRKLLVKDRTAVNRAQDFYIGCFLLFAVISGCIFFSGGDLLLTVFTLTLSNTFLVLAAYSTDSPYPQIGASREMYQIMAYEPMLLLAVIGLYLACGSYNAADIAASGRMPLLSLAGVFVGYLFILTIKFRKSPFDLSIAHHAHQDLVKGLTTEFSGRSLAMIEVAHWYENILLLGIVFLFFCDGTVWGAALGIAVSLSAFFLETFIDNSFARMKWQTLLKSSWAVAMALGVLNVAVLMVV
jgi:ech hydrogenase subunit B